MPKAYLEPSDVEKLERTAEYLRDRLLIRLLFHLGCRVSEALGIRVQDIDFKASTVTIEHLKQRIRLACPDCGARLAKAAKFCPGCGEKVGKAQEEEEEHRRYRALPLDQETLAMLKEYVKRGGMTKEGLLFGLSRHRAWQVVRECAMKAQLPCLVNPESGREQGVSPHRLRDAFAVHAVKLDDSGDGLRLLQQHLGHTSFNTTARYRKVSGEEQKEWYDRLWKGDSSDGQVRQPR